MLSGLHTFVSMVGEDCIFSYLWKPQLLKVQKLCAGGSVYIRTVRNLKYDQYISIEEKASDWRIGDVGSAIIVVSYT